MKTFKVSLLPFCHIPVRSLSADAFETKSRGWNKSLVNRAALSRVVANLNAGLVGVRIAGAGPGIGVCQALWQPSGHVNSDSHFMEAWTYSKSWASLHDIVKPWCQLARYTENRHMNWALCLVHVTSNHHHILKRYILLYSHSAVCCNMDYLLVD